LLAIDARSDAHDQTNDAYEEVVGQIRTGR
jgi:hypothetical protein